MSGLSEGDVRKLSKVELHVHLEGTLPVHRLAELAELAGEPLPRPVDELFTFTSFDEFLEFLTWSVGLVRTPDLESVRLQREDAIRVDGGKRADLLGDVACHVMHEAR